MEQKTEQTPIEAEFDGLSRVIADQTPAHTPALSYQLRNMWMRLASESHDDAQNRRIALTTKAAQTIDRQSATIEAMTKAQSNLVAAVEFYKKVQAASEEERIAVGQDHFNWLKKAAFDLAAFVQTEKADA